MWESGTSITPSAASSVADPPKIITFSPLEASGLSPTPPPPFVVNAPQPAPPTTDVAPPPTSSPPPPTRKILAPAPTTYSPPSPTAPSHPPKSSTAPPPTVPPPPSPTAGAIPPSVPPPPPDVHAPGPPTSSSPPPPSSVNHPPAHESPPPKYVPPPPLRPPTESPPLNSPPLPPEYITPPSPPPPSQPQPSPTNSSSPLTPHPLSPDTPNSSKSSTSINAAAVAAGVGVSLGIIIALCLMILMVWCVVKRKKDVDASLNGPYVMPSPYESSPRADSTLKINSSAPLIQSGSESGFEYSQRALGGLGHSKSSFCYEELVLATDGFSPNNLLGEGGFGYVYKGYLQDGRAIAVKQLKIGSGQGKREFEAEVEIISRIHHRHLVSLVGYCVADSKRLLVYEYVPNNSLYFHLHGEGRPPMDWATRVRVAAGAARGLAYLHEDCHPRVIHRDIKSSNILLNENFDSRVSDFGLAKLALDANTHVTTRVMGTFGYMAPEYASSGKLTEKSDVYSFGVVLLELITGRKPVDSSQPLGDESLVEWARPLLSHAIETAEFGALVDPRLESKYGDAEMFRMIEAAAACVRHSATKRPRMGQVVRAFESILPSDITNGMQMGQSEVHNSAEQSAEIRLFRKMAFGSQNYSTDYFSSDNGQSHGQNNQLVQIESTHTYLHNGNTHVKHDSHLAL